MEQNILCTVNGQSLSADEFYRLKQYLKASYNQRQMEWNEEEMEKVVLEQLIGQALLLQEAEKEGIQPSDEMIAENVEKIKSQFPSEEEFTKVLESQNMTIEKLQSDIFKEISANEYLEKAIPSEETEATDAEIAVYYEQYKASAGEEAQDFEDVKPQIGQMISQQKTGQAISRIVEGLKTQSEIEIF